MSKVSLDPAILQRAPSAETVTLVMTTTSSPQKDKCSESIATSLEKIVEQDETDSNPVNAEICGNIPIPEYSHSSPETPIHKVNPSVEDGNCDQSTDACIDCVKPVPVHSYNEIKPGDHILFVRSTYDHHAIVIEVDSTGEQGEHGVHLKLIHQTNSAFGVFRDFIRPGRRIARLKFKDQTVNLLTQKTLICKYWGTIQPYPRETIVERAREAFNKEKDQFQYNIMDSNCEHFATWCVTGRKLSVQARKIRLVFKLFVDKGIRGISDELARNESEYNYRILCKTCYERNKHPLSIERRPIESQNDINKSDIIMYKYYKLWHCAVVLDVLKRKEGYIKCQIAHYAFCGLLSHRTIKAEPLKISLDGSVIVFVYPDTFKLYEPEDVVARAKRKIGEQMFAFFSNDSSTFSRWCKLQLQ